VQQFVNHDNLQGSNFEVIARNNNTKFVQDVCSGETNAFFVAVGSNPNVYSKIIFENNQLENKHVLVGGVAQNEGKGMFFISSSVARSATLHVFANNNDLTNLILRASDVTGANSPDALFTVSASVDYSQLNPYDFSSTIPEGLPETPENPSAFEDSSLAEVLDQATYEITPDMLAGQESFSLVVDREDLKQVQKIVESQLFSDESNWRLVGVIFKDTESAKRVIAASREDDTVKAAKIRSGFQPGDQIKFHKLIISTEERQLLVLGPSDL
jgi:hypothetical protein